MSNNFIKPLNEYIESIKKRNIKEIIPEFQSNFENINNYDELYKTLIEESNYIYNKITQTHRDKDKSSMITDNNDNYPLQRALIFSSTESKNNEKTRNTNMFLSPIQKEQSGKNLFSTIKINIEKDANVNNIQNNTFNNDLKFLIINCKQLEKEVEKKKPTDFITNFGKVDDNLQRLNEIISKENRELKDKIEKLEFLIKNYENIELMNRSTERVDNDDVQMQKKLIKEKDEKIKFLQNQNKNLSKELIEIYSKFEYYKNKYRNLANKFNSTMSISPDKQSKSERTKKFLSFLH